MRHGDEEWRARWKALDPERRRAIAYPAFIPSTAAAWILAGKHPS
jgi:hypothetical protein